jgi:lysophospholipase L1-like esterase
MKTLFLTLLWAGTLFACSKPGPSLNGDMPGAANITTMPATTYSYLALGDSYTIGESVQQKDSFPYQLSNKLAANGLQNPTIIAQTGWTADNLIAAINNSGLIGKTYDVVTLLIGVNDQYQGLSQANYRTKFVQLLNTAIAFAKNNNKHVYVISIPDYGVTPFAGGNDAVIGPQIDQFNAINYQESVKAGVNYVNITPISKQVATDKTLIAADGLHPSAAMYALWVNLIAQEVAQQWVP